MKQRKYDAVVFTSGTEIKVFLQMLPKGTAGADYFQYLKAICYGPYTTRCAELFGMKVDFTSSSFGSFQGLVEQIKIYYSEKEK